MCPLIPHKGGPVISKMLKSMKVPHVFALLTIVVFCCSLLTYIVPSGSFQRESKVVNGMEKTVVVPGTYESMEKVVSAKGLLISEKVEGKATPVGLMGFLSAIPRGMEEGADIIFFIFMIGGVFGILEKSGVITGMIRLLLNIFRGKGHLLTFIIMVVLAIGGSTLGMGEEFIPLVPIFLLISKEMGYDRIYGLAMVILAAQVGFAAATLNPFTLGVAQGIAEIPLFSGVGFRMVFFVCAISAAFIYTMRYGNKVKANPSRSLVADVPFEGEHLKLDSHRFEGRHIIVMITGILIFAIVLLGVQEWHWWMAEMGGAFFLLGIITAIIMKMEMNEATKAFVKGMEEMVVAALVVGFAKGITVVLSDGQILDSVIYYASGVLDKVPNHLAVQGMLIFQTGLNFIIPSGSGQAAVTMPLMAPIADVIGVTRQTAVFAFQCGDGFSNLVIPTSGILMSMLSLAHIPYERWLRFMLPLFLGLMVMSGIFLAIAVVIGYN